MRDEMYRCDRVEEILGKDLLDEFRNIEALLDLIDYRMVDAADNYRYAYLRLFLHDTLHGKKASTRMITSVVSPVLWLLSKFKHRKTPKADPRLVFSNTFLLSARYPAARETIEKNGGCTAILTYTDMLKLEGKAQQLNLKASLKPERHAARPVYFRGGSIIGGKLEKAVMAYGEAVYGPAGAKDRNAVHAAMVQLREAYLSRVGKIESCLRKEDCALYMTVNQFNLRDLLIIHACKNLGVRTMQQEHFALQFSWLPYSEEKKMDRLSFVGEYGFWNEAERIFQGKVYRYVSPLYRLEEIRYLVTGNPEISREKAEELRKRYPPERKLTLMLASHQDYELEGIRDQYTEWRWKIFLGLRELKDRQKIAVSVRYTPGKEQEFREKEEPILKKWGFRISESVPGNLMEDLLTSCAIMSSTSSVMSTARLFGKPVYRVEDFHYSYVHVDDEVYEVKPEEIADIVIPEGLENTVPEIDFDAIFDVNRIKWVTGTGSR